MQNEIKITTLVSACLKRWETLGCPLCNHHHEHHHQYHHQDLHNDYHHHICHQGLTLKVTNIVIIFKNIIPTINMLVIIITTI